MYIYIYIYVYIYKYIYIYIYIYIYHSYLSFIACWTLRANESLCDIWRDINFKYIHTYIHIYVYEKCTDKAMTNYRPANYQCQIIDQLLVDY